MKRMLILTSALVAVATTAQAVRVAIRNGDIAV